MKVVFEMDDCLYDTAMNIIRDMGYDNMESYIDALVNNDLDMYGIYGVRLHEHVSENTVLA
jgi:hypothetical protein